MFFVICVIMYLFALIDLAAGNFETAWKCVVLGSLSLIIYYLAYIFLRVRELEKFIRGFKDFKSKETDTVDERF